MSDLEMRPAVLSRDGAQYECSWCWRRVGIFAGDPARFINGWFVDGDRIRWRKPHRGRRQPFQELVQDGAVAAAYGVNVGERVDHGYASGGLGILRSLPDGLPIVCRHCAELLSPLH